MANDYRPDSKKVGKYYYDYLERIKIVKDNKTVGLKNDQNFNDCPIDLGMWLIETSLNNEYGFKNDSIAYERNALRFYSLDIIAYDTNGIPVVHGGQLDDIYLDMEQYIIEGNLLDSNFWMCTVILDTILDNSLSISIQPFRGKIYHLWSVLLPGDDPEPFPNGTNLRSCYWLDGVAPLWYENEKRIRGQHFIVPAPGYIFVYWGHEDASFYTMWNWDPDYRFWGGTSGWEMLNTSTCNQYLLSEKDVVDQYNPYPDPNLILGTLLMNYFELQNGVYHGCTIWHRADFYYFEIVYVGFPS